MNFNCPNSELVTLIFLGLTLFAAWPACHSVDVVAVTPKDDEKILSRRRRYVSFPDGSSLSVACGVQTNVLGQPAQGQWKLGFIYGTSYELPNSTWAVQQANGKQSTQDANLEKRRSRRDTYSRLEVLIERIGHNGRGCILRALCESSEFFLGQENNMVKRMLQTIFELPTINLIWGASDDVCEYDKAFNHGKKGHDCWQYQSQCKFSILEMMIGKYSYMPAFM